MEINNRTIAHFDLDTFFVSVERLHNSELMGKSVIIGGMSDRGVVAGCSYEARRFGVHSAMPMRMAKQLCSDAVFIRGDMEQYSKQSRLVTEIIAEQAPVYEKASIDEHYLDITGMDRFFGSLKWTQELRERIIKNTGLPISFGLSVNKTVSKMATGQAKPNGGIHVPQQQVKPFMFPLSIRKIPMIGNKSFRLLRSMGVSTIQTLSMIPPEMMIQVMGKNGLVVWNKANGIDPTPVVQYSERKSVSTEHTFNQDTTDVVFLRNLLISMVDKIAFELRKKQFLTGCVTVKIRYSNFDTHTLQQQLPYTSFDHVLIKTALSLFERLYTRRMLIRLIGVRFSQLVGGNQQLDLFDEDPHMPDLYKAMDQIRLRYGAKSILRGISCRPPSV
ncbi:MAG: DNA polymerase IV [Bacteroidetes bacterium CG18_big_fil_WC_8_21_14_2_50_41_14]|nr:MAG: DNA polymerase IV [Bacteroidetes bacterium CG18_big_fil_WC_8_21_14_2_50_41_14]PJB57690.1 MAG: DNA polymerase IV [Bacteroidetes bacterium CG_4_9_14_3_um_filter_41_19]